MITFPPQESIFYAILNIEGDIVAEMDCGYIDEMVCELRIPDFGDFNESYMVKMLSVERMIMENVPLQDGVHIGTGTAVRID